MKSSIKHKVYNWLMDNMPFWLMYSNRHIDITHKMWLPRWGWSQKQMADAEKNVREKYGWLLKSHEEDKKID